ncbi:MAG: flagellar biosynthesis protein FlhB [Zetaproteobacteria bacterium]|nr:MAG: flagellar biosynthesis protein FlhB [Zetaproteobacteria bacterium]
MPDEQDKSQQTEDASPKKIEDARKKGQVPSSKEPSTAIAFLVLAGLGITGIGSWTLQHITRMMRHYFSVGTEMLRADGPGMQSLLFSISGDMGMIILPIVLPMMILGILVTVMVSGPVFTFETLKPKLEKISPLAGFKRMFSTKGMAEFVKSVLKLCVISLACWVVLNGLLPDVILSSRTNVGAIGRLAVQGTLDIAALSALIFFFIALTDVLYQRWEHAKGLRMSRKEQKDENKDTEGDPQLKAKVRQIQQEQARNRMMTDVPRADVIITNPTHIAIALAYKPGIPGAPKLLAKGKGKTAEKIREIARENRIPIHENKPLARSLYKSVKIGNEIPEELYEAVAIILAEIFRIRTAAQGV